jgi:hypothetical protein
MNTPPKYANHPLLPLIQLLESIDSSKEFQDRQAEILDAIHLAAPVLGDRTPESCRLAKGPFLKRKGDATTPFRMARFVESRIKETLTLTNPPAKSAARSGPSRRNRTSNPQESAHQKSAPIKIMTYRQLRDSLPTALTIPTLGGRAEIEIHNPSYGHLTAINSKGNSYPVTEADWNNACVIRSRNPQNPWASTHYSGISSFYSYGLIHTAALLLHVEEEWIEGLGESSCETLAETI